MATHSLRILHVSDLHERGTERWKTLLKFGLTRFKVISGTSVGALNAALIAMGDYRRAREIWEQLREEKVLKTSKAKKWLVACRFYLDVLMKLLLFSFFFQAGPLLVPALIIFLVPSLIYKDLNHPLAYWISGSSAIVAVALLCIIMKKSGMWLTWTWAEARDEAVKELGPKLWMGSNKPLGNLLRQHVNLASMKAHGVRVYATVTVWASYWDPYAPPEIAWLRSYGPMSTRPDAGLGLYLFGLSSEEKRTPPPWNRSVDLLPHSVEITSLEDDESAREALLQSANLPIVQGCWRSTLRPITSRG